MKIAIHHIKNSFSERWIAYCEKNNIDFEIVDLFKDDIIHQLKVGNFTHLMCQVLNEDSRLINVSNNVYHAAENLGIKTFPSINERWHFDDKIAQKYLFESIDAPFVETNVFYDKKKALEFSESTNYPVVAKLKRGAGSVNVSLIKTKTEAKIYIDNMFNKGINPTPAILENASDKFKYSKKYKNPIELFKKGINYIKRINKERKLVEKEKGYVYFQEYLPNNNFDTRIVVVNGIAFGLRRINRENDFRASGSGKIDYDRNKIDIKMVDLAFKISDKCNFTIMGYDFLYSKEKKPLVVELCYAFTSKAYDKCEGFWSKDLLFHEETFSPHEVFIKDFLN